ncbi:hypothetical protein F2Q68_00046149, partial [Brassica cretica]
MEKAIERQRVLLEHLCPSSSHSIEGSLTRTSLYGDDVVIVAAHRTALCKSKRGNFKDTFPDDHHFLQVQTWHRHHMFGDRRWDFVAKVSGPSIKRYDMVLAAGLNRIGKNCRLRLVNYLHSGLKRGKMTQQEERLVLELHAKRGNRWSKIARKLSGRTDNEIKNYCRTHMRKKAQEKKKRPMSPASSSSNCCSSSMTTASTQKRVYYENMKAPLKEEEDPNLQFYHTYKDITCSASSSLESYSGLFGIKTPKLETGGIPGTSSDPNVQYSNLSFLNDPKLQQLAEWNLLGSPADYYVSQILEASYRPQFGGNWPSSEMSNYPFTVFDDPLLSR